MLQRYTMCDTVQEEKSKEEVKVPVEADDMAREELLQKKYSFIVNNSLGKAIKDQGILVENMAENLMAGQFFVLASNSLASSFPFRPSHRHWSYTNTNPPCIVHVTGDLAKRIFQNVPLPKAIIWEDRHLGTCVWTLEKRNLGDFPQPL